MRILSIVANKFYNTNQVQYPKNNGLNIFMTNPIPFDTVSFTASAASGTPLKKLAEYGMPDMYTGKMMMSYGNLSRMLKNGVFNMPLNKMLPILYKYYDCLHSTEQKVLKLLQSEEKKQPDIRIDEAFKKLFPEHEKKLIDIQKPILFEKLVSKTCDMPIIFHNDFMTLLRYTNDKIQDTPTISHFSEKEFIYRLQQVAKQIKVKNKHSEVSAINNLIREAKKLFSNQIEEKKKFGRGIAAKKVKMEYQLQPAILKQNTQNMQYLRNIFENSCLKNNNDIKNIFNITDAKICAAKIVEPFKRQEFIYDLKNIVKFLNDKELEMEIISEARKLPTSADNVSAFIVKHANDSPEKIGYYLFKGSLASIEHIEPKVSQAQEESAVKTKKKKKKKKTGNNVGGKNHINNYGLSSAYINSLRSNMPFDEWIRKNPTAYIGCQKYVDRLIELYNEGKFKKVGLNKNYIINFVDLVRTKSPKEKPIILNLNNFIE